MTVAGADRRPQVMFQGERGAYSEDAIVAYWGGRAEPVPARDCASVAHAVDAGVADYGVLPIENTLAGSVVATYDALTDAAGVVVVGEVVLPIHHCLLAPRGATLRSLAAVESHPVALAQCRRFLEDNPAIEARAAYDTAGAARAVSERGDPRCGAIASRAAAERFGLAVIAADIEDRHDNQTRFLVLARSSAVDGAAPAHDVPARTALLATTENVPGALLRVLQPLADAGLNLSKIESRPAGTPWTYRFFLEVDHSAGDARLDGALETVRAAASSVRVLGTFARGAPNAPVVSRAADDPELRR